MKNKRLVSFLFLVLFVFSVSVAVFAADTPKVLTYAVESSDSIASSGEKVTVDLLIEENSGFLWSRVDIEYNPEHLIFDVDATVEHDAVVNPKRINVNFNADKPGKMAVILGSQAAFNPDEESDAYTKTGKIVTLTFTVVNPTADVYTSNIVVKAEKGFTLSTDRQTNMNVTAPTEPLTLYLVGAKHVHDIEILPGKPADCVNDGLTEGEKCKACGLTLKAQEVIKAEGHKEVNVPAKKVTCTEDGNTAYSYCSVCDEVLSGEKVIYKCTGHLEVVTLKAVTPTCTTTGKTEGQKCNVCGVVIKAQQTIGKVAHTVQTLPAVAPTCTEPGKTEGKMCSVCKTVLTAQTTVSALGHTLGEYINNDPDGHYRECSVCDFVEPKTAHTYVNGTCSVCGYGCAHTGGTATCDKKAVCTKCGSEYGELKAHTPGPAATCTAAQTCTACGKELNPKLNHSLVVHPGQKPTCTDKGYEPYDTCSKCNYTTYKELPAAGHKLTQHPAKDATCGEKGNKAYETCENCDHTTFEEIPATGNHTYGEWETVKEATRKEAGEKKHTCTVCGHVETEAIPMVTGLPTGIIIAIIVGVVAVVALIIVIVLLKKKK